MTGGDITIGVDIGTTSVKALAVDADGTVLASARVPHPLRAAPGRLEHDADAAWRAGVCEAYRQVVAGCQDVLRSPRGVAGRPGGAGASGAGPRGAGVGSGDAGDREAPGAGGGRSCSLDRGSGGSGGAAGTTAGGAAPGTGGGSGGPGGAAGIAQGGAGPGTGGGSGGAGGAVGTTPGGAGPGTGGGTVEVRAVAVSAMVPSLTAVDSAGRPVAPGLLYGDARGGGAPGADPASAGEAAGFLRWLAAEAPGAAGFWPAQAVANRALCGRAALDFATAWCTSPLFDGQQWSADVLAAAGVRPEQLPDVVAGDGPVGRVGDEPDGPLVGPGTVDALAAQHVAGADQPGDVLVILGATLIVWAVVPGWVERPGLWTVPHTVPGLCLVGGASNAGGLFVDWAGRLLGDPPGTIDLTVAGADVPVWLPYLRGERTPLHDPAARAELSGLHIGHGPAELRRATYEASGFVARRIIERAYTPPPQPAPGAGTGDAPGHVGAGDARRAPARSGERPPPARPGRIVAVGGGVRAPGWVHALADCTGLDVDVAAVPDASALGAAFLARCTAGLESGPANGRRWARTASTVRPDPAWRAACDHRYQRFLTRTTAAESDDPT